MKVSPEHCSGKELANELYFILTLDEEDSVKITEEANILLRKYAETIGESALCTQKKLNPEEVTHLKSFFFELQSEMIAQAKEDNNTITAEGFKKAANKTLIEEYYEGSWLDDLLKAMTKKSLN